MSLLVRRERYRVKHLERLRAGLAPALECGGAILDVGSGRTPFLGIDQRPSEVTYVGLDISAEELAAAPPGSYDEAVVSSVEQYVPSLEGRFDAAVSFQVFEHVDSLEMTLDNIWRYLKPGGVLSAQFSGKFSFFGIANQLLPTRLSHRVVAKLYPNREEAGQIFPAPYNRCWYGAITPLLSKWSSAEVTPIYRGANYLRVFPPAQGAYLIFEDWLEARNHRNLAGYYRIVARK